MTENHPFAVLAGTWKGEGEGSYPTIANFAYLEEFTVEPVAGRPLAHWRSRTKDRSSGEPRHAESGFLRMTAGGVELVVAHGFGVVETATGSLLEGALTLESHQLVGTPSAKRVDRVERRYELNGDSLHYTLSMAAVDVPLTHHLEAVLHRA